MPIKFRRALIAIVVLLVLAIGVTWLRQPKALPVALITVDGGQVESSISNTRAGAVEACQRAKMSPAVGGRIEYLGVNEGDRVKAGQVLMRLWNGDQLAQASLAQAQTDTARRRVTEACTAADSATREAERNRELKEKGFVSVGKEEQSRMEAAVRRAACETAQSDVKSAEAKTASVRVEQRRTVLIAPFAGTIAKIVGEVGEYATPSPPGVATQPTIDLIDDSCLYVKAPMDEVDAPRIQIGQPVRISLDALPGKSFSGKVRRIAPYISAVEKQARTVDVEVAFDNAADAGRLLVGYSADVEIILAVHDKVLRVPTATLLEGGRVLVLAVEPGESQGKLESRVVKVGIANWAFTEVLDGLKLGERIVTSLEREGVKEGVLAKPDPVSAPTNVGK